MNGIFNLFITENGGNEFCRTIRLITGTKSAGKHQNLGLTDCLFKSIYTVRDVLLRHIFKYNALCISTCCLERKSGIILTVCSREYRNKYGRFCHFMFAYINVFRIVKSGIDFFVFHTGTGREYFFQSATPSRKCFLHGNHFIITLKLRFIQCLTNLIIRNTGGIQHSQILFINLCYNFTITRCKEIFFWFMFAEFSTNLITKCHLRNGIGNTVAINCLCGTNYTITHQFRNLLILTHNKCKIRKVILILLNCEFHKTASCFFQFVCYNIRNLSHINSKGTKGRRYINIVKGTGHTIFTTNGRKTKFNLCIICT